MVSHPELKNRTCCCGIPTRIGVAILAWFYFLAGITATVLAIMGFIRSELTVYSTTGSLVILVAVLGLLLTGAAAFGIAATIGQSPVIASFFSGLFICLLFLQLAFDVGVIVLIFTKQLDSLIPICYDPRAQQAGTCDSGRSWRGAIWTAQAAIRFAIGFYFSRRIASFSRHCAERADPELHAHLMSMVASAKAPKLSGGTTFASNFPIIVHSRSPVIRVSAPDQDLSSYQTSASQEGFLTVPEPPARRSRSKTLNQPKDSSGVMTAGLSRESA